MRKAIYLTIAIVGFVFTSASAVDMNYMRRDDKVVAVKDSTTDDSDTTDDDLNRMFAFGLEYSSDQAQHGLHNDIKLPYIEPNFTYTAPKGFYIELSDQYVLPKKVAGFDALCFNPGWDIDFGDNTTLNFNYAHYVFNPNSPNLVKSTLSNSLESYVDQWIGNLRGKFEIEYSIYKGMNSPNDIAFTPDLMYKFKWKLGENSKLKIKPEASIDIGTRNFYTQYEKAVQKDSAAKNTKYKTKTIESNANSSFGTLDYNLILSVGYAVGKFEFDFSYTYTDPLYKPSNIPDTPIGYGSLSITYTISTK